MKRKIIFILFALVISGASFAEEKEIELNKIVVTPYKTGVSERLNPASTDVVSQDTMEGRRDETLKEAIQDIPSISFATTGGLGGETGVNIRGAGSNHTQVLLDGIKLYDPISTSAYFYAYDFMGLGGIGRIEVLKGPFSSLYGSDSLGGTISMLTKKGSGRPHLSYNQELGSYRTLRETFASDGEMNKFSYSLSVNREDVDSFYSAKYKNGNTERDPYHNLNASLRLDYALTDNIAVGLLNNYTQAKYEYDGTSWTPPYPPVDDDDNQAHFYQGVSGANITHQLTDKFSYKGTLAYTRTYRTGWEDIFTDYWYNGTTYQGKWQGEYQFCGWDKAVFGFDYLREMGEGVWSPSRTPKETANTKGYYLENIFTPLDNLFISGSFRTEDHSIFGLENTYSASASYIFQKTDTKIKGSYGKGFKAPSLYQLFDTYSGNRGLEPEISKSFEAGLEQSLMKKLTLGATYFNTRFTNLIDWMATGFWTGKYQNAGKATTKGEECFAQYDFNLETSLKVSYTHLKAIKADGTRLNRRPDNKLSCNFKTAYKKFSLESELSYVGDRIDGTRKLKSYLLGNLTLNYTPGPQWQFYTKLENIFDSKYELVSGYQTPEFSWYIGTKFSF